jgi:hypothetical protein
VLFQTLKWASVHHSQSPLSTVFGLPPTHQKRPEKKVTRQLNVTKELTDRRSILVNLGVTYYFVFYLIPCRLRGPCQDWLVTGAVKLPRKTAFSLPGVLPARAGREAEIISSDLTFETA